MSGRNAHVTEYADSNQKTLPTTPQDIFRIFSELEIDYTLYEHEPVFTVSESAHLQETIPGVHCRNLFVRDKKENMFLVVVPDETPVDLKKLKDLLGCGRLSFGSEERLWKYLGIRPGSVCPFCAINDNESKVRVILDKKMMDSRLVCYHPLDNSMTISISPEGLMKFLRHIGSDSEVIDLTLASPEY